MIEAGAATATAEQEQPKALRLSRSYYLRPDQVKALDEACYDLAPVLREKLSPSKVLERLIDRKLAEYLSEEKGAPASAAGRAPRRRKRDGGNE